MLNFKVAFYIFLLALFFSPAKIYASFDNLDDLVDDVALLLVRPLDLVLTDEEIAQDVVAHVDHRITNIDSMERFTLLDPWLIGLAGNIDEEHQQAREMAGMYYKARAEWAWERGRGTSEDSAVLTYYILQEAHKRREKVIEERGMRIIGGSAEFYQPDIRILSNAEHETRTEDAYHFVVWSDIPKEGEVRNANDPATWGENALVLDGRRGDIYTVNEVKDEKYYSGEEEKLVSDSTAEFDEERAAEPKWEGRRRGSIFAEDCLIALAFYGYPRAAELAMLRQFRDEVLLNSPVGRQGVELYYRYSPAIASFIAPHDLLRGATRVFFVDPLANAVTWIFEHQMGDNTGVELHSG